MFKAFLIFFSKKEEDWIDYFFFKKKRHFSITSLFDQKFQM